MSKILKITRSHSITCPYCAGEAVKYHYENSENIKVTCFGVCGNSFTATE